MPKPPKIIDAILVMERVKDQISDQAFHSFNILMGPSQQFDLAIRIMAKYCGDMHLMPDELVHKDYVAIAKLIEFGWRCYVEARNNSVFSRN